MKKGAVIAIGLIVAIAAYARWIQSTENNNLASKAVDPGGSAAGTVYVVVNREEFTSGGSSSYTTGYSDRWVGGKQTNNNPFGESYDRGWWFDLILPDGTYDGCAAIGWDAGTGRVKFLCRSWQNIDLTLTKPDGEVVSYEHRPKDLSPLSVTTNQAEQGVAPQSAARSESDSEGDDKPQPESELRLR